MNSYEFVEIAGLFIIVAAQVYYFWLTRKSIDLLKHIFLPADHFNVIKFIFLKNDANLDPRTLLDNVDHYIDRAKSIELGDAHGYAEAELIVQESAKRPYTTNILRSINIYLLRNRGAASDFHLIKDLVESHCDIVEDEISQSISLPLYLGLLGTFMGIVFGLFQLSGMHFSTSNGQLDDAITFLLGGVRISMIASFIGLLLTVINSAFGFNRAKKQLQTCRNEFYTFVKTDLLPVLNQNINSTLYSLQHNLHRFNESFGAQIEKLNKIMDRNYEALMAQDRILTTIDQMDVTSYAKANVKVLSELRITTDQLVNFNVGLDTMNGLIERTRSLANDVATFTTNTSALADIGKDLHAVFSENKALQEFLKSHYTALDESHRLITTSVNNVYNTLDESLDTLKSFMIEKTAEIRKLSLQEIDHLENKYPDKWNQLDNLSYLSGLSDNVRDFKEQHSGGVLQRLNEIGKVLSGLSKTMEEIKQQEELNLFDRSWVWFTGKKRRQ